MAVPNLSFVRRLRSLIGASAALIVSLFIVMPACSSAEFDPDDWRSEVALDVDAKLGGCAMGELNAQSPGQEIAVVASDGHLHVVSRRNGRWTSEIVGRTPGEMIQCAVGDLMPERPGDEIVVVGAAEGGEDDGGAGAAWIFSRQDAVWKAEELVVDDALLHAVAIGELREESSGQELFLAGYTGVGLILSRENGQWREERTDLLGGEAKGAAIAQGTVAVTCANGLLVRLRRDEGRWRVRELARSVQPLARVAAQGADVLYCDNGGALRVVTEKAKPRRIYQADDRLRGAVLADLDPTRPGLEYATAGYDGTMVVLYELMAPDSQGTGGAHLSHVVGEDDDRFHHLCHGEVGGLGRILAACGYGGRLVVSFRREGAQ